MQQITLTQVTNNGTRTPIGLPGGQVIAPGATEVVKNWEEVKDHKVVAYYLANGILSADDSPAGEGGALSREQLFERLKALGVEVGANAKDETLRKRLDEAEKAAKLAAIEELKALDVPASEDASLEELQKALAEKKQTNA